MKWERRHSPLTYEGRLEDIARFADGLRQARRSPNQRGRVRQFGLVIIVSVIVVTLVAIIGGVLMT